MSIETIGPIVIIFMLLGLLFVVGVGLGGDGKAAPKGDDQPRHSLE